MAEKDQDAELSDVHVASSWEFPDDPPAPDEVLKRLQELPPWYGGIKPEKYLDFVQPLSQRKKMKAPGGAETHKEMWTLYITVAGRQAAINAMADEKGWRVDFEPEPVTPTGIPGYLQFDGDRIVYREYAVIYDENDRLLGRKPGTAWVPAEGGGGAVRSNRFEKCETSARGRAIAAWGIGVLPGSGVASLDEMTTAQELARVAQITPQGGRVPRNKDDVVEEARLVIAEYQEQTAISDEDMFAKVHAFCLKQFDKAIERTENGAIGFGRMKLGEIAIFTNMLRQEVAKFRRDQPL
jgi:hypothetical protein